MTFAFMQNDKVVLIKDYATSEEAAFNAFQYQAIIDVTDTVPQPQVGWLFDGFKLTAPETKQV